MSIARDVFYSISGLSLFVLTAGTVASPIAGCSTSFCVAPVINLAGQIAGINTPSKPSEPAKPSTAPHSPVTTPDMRLSICPQGSVEATAPEVPSTLARELDRRLKQGVTFRSLPELQGVLGQPRCNFRDGKAIRWRYLIRGGGSIDAVEDNGKVDIKVTP
ncbi:hypothetical protein [Laspinema olomoucense]|uniref:Lipoprotein SmpA/OmlA domain-containing protein n=1 Tax=Laspinema olomoucense D3b TaxID=2953688 RepID=A0ABT2NFQ3_9CYAN|nr:hypothetical protein [Laspinema sp. D3b]MCT7981535.1 hypothetical protein [Laspinema sp. D3b]